MWKKASVYDACSSYGPDHMLAISSATCSGRLVFAGLLHCAVVAVHADELPITAWLLS